MISRYLVTMLLILCSSVSFSQSVFEFDYYFDVNKTREHYKALLVRNGDGTGFIRVRFKDDESNSWVIAEMDMKEHYFGDEAENDAKKTDSSIMVFEGLNPKIVSGHTKIVYDPDIFLFQLNKQTDVYDPVAVISGDDDENDLEGVISNVRLLNEEDLTKDFVLQYFTQKEGLYENLFEEATVRPVTPQQKDTRLILLLVANTDDISIGSTCLVDKDATYNTFSQLAEFLKLKFEPTLIWGKNFSKVNVDNAINAIQPGSNDIVVFYYSGHGFNDVQSNKKFPFLDLRDKTFQSFGDPYTLNIEDIYQRIKAKNGRLNLVFSDCCNADPSQTNLMSSEGATTRNSSIGWNIANCWSLFMDQKRQSILMTAASKGELSAGTSAGGIFTYNFRESLEKLIGPFYNNATWNNILTTAQKQTIQKAQNTWCVEPDKPRKACVQNPIFKME